MWGGYHHYLCLSSVLFFNLAAFVSGGIHNWRLPVGLWTDHYLARRRLSDLCSGMEISWLVLL